MKKSFFYFLSKFKNFILLFFLVCPIVIFSACGEVDLSESKHTYVSEYRRNLFINKTSLFFASFTSGERERDYVLNGEKTNLTDFGVLTVKFNSYLADETLKFELTIDDEVYSNECEHNPYDNSYVFDIEKQVDDNDEITLKLIDFEQNIKLVCVSKDWKTTWEDSLNDFNIYFEKEIKNHTKNAKFDGEIYVKIVSDSFDTENFYWYVLCVCKDGNVYSCLVDVNTNEIVQMK